LVLDEHVASDIGWRSGNTRQKLGAGPRRIPVFLDAICGGSGECERFLERKLALHSHRSRLHEPGGGCCLCRCGGWRQGDVIGAGGFAGSGAGIGSPPSFRRRGGLCCRRAASDARRFAIRLPVQAAVISDQPRGK